MASLGDVGAVLGVVLNKIDEAISAHHRAAELADETRTLLIIAGTGSNQADVEQVCAMFASVVEKITEPEGQISALATAADLIRSYMAQLGIDNSAAGPSTPAPARAPTVTDTSTASEQTRVKALHATLPPPVQPNSGQKTHGQWFSGPQGQTGPIVSGQDAESAEAWRILRDVGCPLKGPPITITHAEIKLAARMNRDKIRNATVVLNNVPCEDIWGCDNLGLRS